MFDFLEEDRGSAVFRDPLAVTPDETELIFQLPNGLNAFFMANEQGQRFSCHNAGFVTFNDEMRDAWSSPAVVPDADQAACTRRTRTNR